MHVQGQWTRQTGCPTHNFSLVVVRKTDDKGKDLFLAVEESRNRGWWLPGGFVECGDNFVSTASKETREEAGLDIKLLGILAVQSSLNKYMGRQRVIFLAEPADPKQAPKSVPDEESKGAAWMTVEELEKKSDLSPPEGLRSDELLVWAKYLLNGGPVYPLGLLMPAENSPPHFPSKEERVRMEGMREKRK